MGTTAQARTTLVSTKQAAEISGRSVWTINRWVREGALSPAVEGEGPRGARFFFRADVERVARYRS